MKTESIPYEIKLTYIIALVIVVLFAAFILFVVFIYNKKQLVHFKEKQLVEANHKNAILQKELEKQKTLEKERQRISRDMHDDLGSAISALKLHAEFMKRKVGENKELLKDVEDILNTSQEMNLAMREMLWSLNKKHDTISDLVDYASKFAENFFSKLPVTLDINYQISEDKNISSEARRNLFLSFKEAINNIYKHSFANRVEICFIQKENIFSLEVSDNGIGLENNKKQGNGLYNMISRIEQVGGICEFINLEKGLKVKFILEIFD